MTDSRKAALRFYGVGILVIAGLLTSAIFRISTVVPADRPKAAGYLLVAAALGALLMWSSVRVEGSPWRGTTDRPAGDRYWKLMVVGVVVPLLDDILAGGTLLIAEGVLIATILVVFWATERSSGA